MAGFCDIIREPLAGVRRGIVAEAARYKPWYLLPLIVCEAISGHYEHAIPASAALQLFMAAGEVFDDIEDADASGSLSARYGSAIATNVATTLLILAERAITRLKGRGVADCVIVRVMDAVNSFYTTACAGQHLDLSLTSETTVSEDIYLRVAVYEVSLYDRMCLPYRRIAGHGESGINRLIYSVWSQSWDGISNR